MNYDFVVTKIERVALIGKEEYPDKHISFSPSLKCNELIFRFNGEATILFDDLILKSQKNSIRFLPKGEASKYELFHNPGDCILIDFQTDKPVSQKALVINMPKNESIGQLFQKIFTCWINKKKDYYFRCLSILYLILAEMQMENFTLLSHQKKIQPAIDEIHKHFLDKNLTTSKLADICGISETYFKRLFKEKYNISPRKYIIKSKIEYACSLLLLKQYSIKQISELCNYSDIYFFSRQFKEYIGISPTDFINKYISSK